MDTLRFSVESVCGQPSFRFGDYLAGFVDGEGCFCLDKPVEDRPGGACFAIKLRRDDRDILEQIRNFLNCGVIRYGKPRGNGSPQACFTAKDTTELLFKIVPCFEKHRLRAKKARDFEIWKQGLVLLYRVKSRKRRVRGYLLGCMSKWTTREREEYQALHNELQEIKVYSDVNLKQPTVRIEKATRNGLGLLGPRKALAKAFGSLVLNGGNHWRR